MVWFSPEPCAMPVVYVMVRIALVQDAMVFPIQAWCWMDVACVVGFSCLDARDTTADARTCYRLPKDYYDELSAADKAGREPVASSAFWLRASRDAPDRETASL